MFLNFYFSFLYIILIVGIRTGIISFGQAKFNDMSVRMTDFQENIYTALPVLKNLVNLYPGILRKLHFLGIKEITLFPYPQCKKVLVISVSRTSLYKRYSKANESSLGFKQIQKFESP